MHREDFKQGSYTDDTQMSLATAEGCIRAYQGQSDNKNFQPFIMKCINVIWSGLKRRMILSKEEALAKPV